MRLHSSDRVFNASDHVVINIVGNARSVGGDNVAYLRGPLPFWHVYLLKVNEGWQAK